MIELLNGISIAFAISLCVSLFIFLSVGVFCLLLRQRIGIWCLLIILFGLFVNGLCLLF